MTIFWVVVGSGVVGMIFYVVHLIRTGAVFKKQNADLRHNIKLYAEGNKMEKAHDEETDAILEELNRSERDNGIKRVRSPHIPKDP
jgi:hypothetical protein